MAGHARQTKDMLSVVCAHTGILRYDWQNAAAHAERFRMSGPGYYAFGPFRLHPARRELTRDGRPVELGSRALDVLLALLRRHGETATKTDIMAAVWPDVVVEENNLTTQIASVRRVLGETDATKYIQTVPGRGYRFVGEVQVISGPPASPAASAAPNTLPEAVGERHNLPTESSSFIGRDRELADVRARLSTRPLVTLVGAGGVGKTRVALKLAGDMLDEFPDGVFLLELAPLTEARLVAEALCRVLGVPATGDRPAESVAVSVLRQKRMLLVLDNCEHVLGAAAALAAAVLRNCPQLRVLATSREALGVPGEAVFPMPSLAVPSGQGRLSAAEAMQSDSVRLFAERAADALGGYTLTDADAAAVVTICRRLDGVPLATELAAARLRMLKPAEIASRLENVFRLLTGGSRTALPRQQTLRATIDWSFSLLCEAEQVVLRRLSVFVDGCPLKGAVAVAAGPDVLAEDVFDLVSALVGKSLVVADTAGPVTRFRMLETTRRYAAEKLHVAGEAGRTRDMATFMLATFRRAEAAWPTQATAPWLAAFGPEAENLRAAIDWAFGPEGDPELGVSLVAASGAIAEEMSLQADLRRWTDAAVPHLTESTPKSEAASVLYLHTMLIKRLGMETVPVERKRAIDLFREAGDAVGLSRALRQTAIARAMPGDVSGDVLAMLEEAVGLLTHLAPHKDLATALAHTGGVYFLNARLEECRAFNEAALEMRRALGDRSGVLASGVNMAELLFLDGDVAAALRYAMAAEAEARSCNAVATLTLILCNLAGYRLHCNDVDGAAAAGGEALGLSRAIGQDYLAVMCLEHLALVLALRFMAEPAAIVLGFADAHYRTAGQTREWLEQAGHDRLVTKLTAALPGDRLARLLAEGAACSADAIDAVALRGSAPGETVGKMVA
jgi:predicted ATPase/DNA-binding winged helix-turn-helix (wHTH) protein